MEHSRHRVAFGLGWILTGLILQVFAGATLADFSYPLALVLDAAGTIVSLLGFRTAHRASGAGAFPLSALFLVLSLLSSLISQQGHPSMEVFSALCYTGFVWLLASACSACLRQSRSPGAAARWIIARVTSAVYVALSALNYLLAAAAVETPVIGIFLLCAQAAVYLSLVLLVLETRHRLLSIREADSEQMDEIRRRLK